MFYKLPDPIKEIIYEFSGEREDIKNKFMKEIAPKIDESLILIPNGCHMCYIASLKENKYLWCQEHSDIEYSKMPNVDNRPQYFSVYSLLYYTKNNIFLSDLDMLYRVFNYNNEYYLNAIYKSWFYETHKKTALNEELKHYFGRY
jgi:hypothetical protein